MAAQSPTGLVEGEVLFMRGPGAGAVVACHWTRSPVGPFAEVLTLRPARQGRRPRLAVSTLAVGSREAAAGWPGRQEAAALRWWSGGRRRELLWEGRGLRLRLETGAVWVFATIPVRTLHPEWDGGDRPATPGRLSPVRLQVEVPDDDPLAYLASRRRGILLSSGSVAVDELRFFLARPARVPPAVEPS